MADIGLPGSVPVSQYSAQVLSAEGAYYASSPAVQNNVALAARLTFITTHNYLYKCPAANSGIRNNQVLWF